MDLSVLAPIQKHLLTSSNSSGNLSYLDCSFFCKGLETYSKGDKPWRKRFLYFAFYSPWPDLNHKVISAWFSMWGLEQVKNSTHSLPTCPAPSTSPVVPFIYHNISVREELWPLPFLSKSNLYMEKLTSKPKVRLWGSEKVGIQIPGIFPQSLLLLTMYTFYCESQGPGVSLKHRQMIW